VHRDAFDRPGTWTTRCRAAASATTPLRIQQAGRADDERDHARD
jgi:hypothetical protein